MAKLPEAGARLELDLSTWTRQFGSAMSDANKLDAALNDLGGTVDLKVNVTDTDLKTAKGLADDLNSSTSLKVNVDDKDIDSASDKLDSIASMQAIDLAINIAGTAKDFFEGLGRFSGVGGILELDNALALIEGRTGRMIPNAEKLISDLYTNGWGESREQIAQTIVEAANLKIANEDLAEATLTAFQVQSVMGGDTNEILRTMDSLVKNNLAPDFQSAGDIIVTGLQNGADRGQDLLDTFNEYGSTFGQLRISGEGALALINSGLEAGVDNSDRIADAIRETGIKLGEIGTNEDVATAFKRLDELSDIDLAGLLDAYNAGAITGDQFFEGFFSAFADANEAAPQEAGTLATSLIGTQSEDFKIGAISQLTTQWDETMGTLENRAEDAGNAVSNTLGTSIETLLRTLEQGATDFLSSEQIDLPGKIDAIKTGITEALGILSAGGSVGEALDVGLGIQGVDTALGNIERVFGQFVISLLEIVATIQDPLGINDADAAARSQIKQLATQQLPFDIKLANPEELDAIFNQAANRGVTDLGGALNTALTELVSEGDFAKVNDILDQIALSAEVTPEAVEALRTKYEGLMLEAQNAATPPPLWTDDFVKVLGGKALPTDNDLGIMGLGQTGRAISKTDAGGWWESFKPPPEVETEITNFGTNTTDTLTAVNNAAATNSQGIVDAIYAMGTAATEADTTIATAMTGNTVTASFEAVAASAQENMARVEEGFELGKAAAASFDQFVSIHLRNVMKQLNDLNFLAMQTLASITAVGNGTVPVAAGGGSTTNVNNNVTVNNNVNNTASAVANGYAIARTLRPGG